MPTLRLFARFREIAGTDTVVVDEFKKGAFNAPLNEIQRVLVFGNGGTFDLTLSLHTNNFTPETAVISFGATASDLEAFFTTAAESQPVQPGILELNATNDELTIQYGATAFSVPRPTAFMLDDNSNYDCGTLVKQ